MLGRIWKSLNEAAGPIGAVVVLAGAIWGAVAFIDHRIDVRINDPRVVQHLAAQVRPTIIFDSENRVLADQGGMRFIESIAYTPDEGYAKPAEILVTPTEFLAVPPLLESLDVEGYTVEAERGPGISWRYLLHSRRIFEHGVQVQRFRLEIVR